MAERTRLEWAEMSHYHHFRSDGTFIAAHHPICPICNPHILEGDPTWHETPTSEAATETSAPTVTALERTTTARSVGLAEDRDGEVADSASWAYEPRQEWLARTLKRSPHMAPALIAWGLWTGKYDQSGDPIPSDRALRSGMSDYLADRVTANPQGADSLVYAGFASPGSLASIRGESLWAHLVFPVYSGPDPQENKRRSLRDTLITNPECGPRLVSVGLWAGTYDDAGLPVPTLPKPERHGR